MSRELVISKRCHTCGLNNAQQTKSSRTTALQRWGRKVRNSGVAIVKIVYSAPMLK